MIPSTGEYDNTPPTLVMSQRMIISSSPAPQSILSRSSSRAGTGRLSRSATVSSTKYGMGYGIWHGMVKYHFLCNVSQKDYTYYVQRTIGLIN